MAIQHPNALLYPNSTTSFIGKTISMQLPSLRQISFVLTCNGQYTYFWLDTWLHQQPLTSAFPKLFTHSTQKNVRVAAIFRDGLESNLQDRLTSVASQELVSLSMILQDFMPEEDLDSRFLHGGKPFSTRNAYTALACGNEEDLNAKLMWET